MTERKENIPVFLVTNWDMVGYTATTMASIMCNTKRRIDFYVMDCGLSDFDRKQLSTMKQCFPAIDKIEFYQVDMKRFEGMNVWYYGMLDAWAMLLFPEAFPNVHGKAVHVESDTLIVDDIEKLYNESLDGYTIGACPEIAFGALNDLFPSKEHVYFNLGMLLIDCDKWRTDETTEHCLELGRKYGKEFNCLHQDALNMFYYDNKYKKLPNTKGRILVSDVSSCFLSEPMDVTNYGVVYGGVQKNIGPAGVVIAIIREDLITDDVLPGTPTMLKWKTQADNDSLYNTPPCYNIYICGKVFKWLKKMGGLSVMKERNEEKAKILYDFLDQSSLFKGTVRKEDRSLMNVPFVTGNEELDAKFVKEAAAAGFVNLKGHRTVGGMRASIYNAMPKEGVEKLVEFMKKFEEENA